MNEIAEMSEIARQDDPREVLDGLKRARIVAMLEMGCSRRVAARHVGCAASTITRTAQRDPDFAAELGDAESQAEVRALKLIGRMLDQEKYWRVAAWMLERRDPEAYGRRAPYTFRGGDVITLLERLMDLVMPAIAANQAAEIRGAFYDLLDDVAEKANLRPPERETPCADVAGQEIAPAESRSALPSKKETVPLAASRATPLATHVKAAAVAPSRDDKETVPRQAAHPASPPPVNRQRRKTVAASSKNGHAPRLLDELLPPRPRTSCLEQFVQRLGKPELQPAGA
jgi:hypothetical protein